MVADGGGRFTAWAVSVASAHRGGRPIGSKQYTPLDTAAERLHAIAWRGPSLAVTQLRGDTVGGIVPHATHGDQLAKGGEAVAHANATCCSDCERAVAVTGCINARPTVGGVALSEGATVPDRVLLADGTVIEEINGWRRKVLCWCCGCC